MPAQGARSDKALWGVMHKAFGLSQLIYLNTQMERGLIGHTGSRDEAQGLPRKVAHKLTSLRHIVEESSQVWCCTSLFPALGRQRKSRRNFAKSRPASSIKRNPGQPVLHRKILSQKIKTESRLHVVKG